VKHDVVSVYTSGARIGASKRVHSEKKTAKTYTRNKQLIISHCAHALILIITGFLSVRRESYAGDMFASLGRTKLLSTLL